jgi:hypothetical protein
MGYDYAAFASESFELMFASVGLVVSMMSFALATSFAVP